MALPPAAVMLGGGVGGAAAVDVERGDRCALAGKAHRDGAADAGTRAGDGRDVVLQETRHIWRPPLEWGVSSRAGAGERSSVL